MSTELVAPNEGSLVPATLGQIKSKFAEDSVLEAMSGGSFLPRLQLVASNSRVAIKKKCPSDTYALVKGSDNIVRALGDSVDCLILCWRPKAVRFEGNKAKFYYNPKDPAFRAIEQDADKKPRVQGAMYGPEYLLYIPCADAIATFHLNNPTMRNRAGELKPLIERAATFKVEIIERPPHIWPGPIFMSCSTPLELPEFGTPEAESLWSRCMVQKEKFCNPPSVEVVEESEEAAESSEESRPR